VTTPRSTVWDIEPHTLAKHEILRRYLGAWFAILGSTNPRIVYIDGFCGPGRYSGGEPGSPIIALREALAHAERLGRGEIDFLFVDERPDRITHLNNELRKLRLPSNFLVNTEPCCFEDVLTKWLEDSSVKAQPPAPTFAFIDQFGFSGPPFALVRRLLANPKTEVLVNVMIDAANRFLDHPDDQIRQHLVDLFGTQAVLQIARGGDDRLTALRLLYQAQLSTCARFVRYFEMRDQNDRVIYCLFFASNHPLGHAKMKEAFWKVDPASGFCFSDATNPDQLLLFEQDQTQTLATELAARFCRHSVSVLQVKTYVEDSTAFTATHMRAALRSLEESSLVSVQEYKLNGIRRKRNTYPDNATMQFA
jgi:three-Cys-motif partner protein